MTVSADFRSFSRPILALFVRFAPSLVNGNVTIAIVRAPRSLANCPMTGSDPVPVPPPRPPVRNTISASCHAASSSIRAASAAPSPIFGSEPAPSPLVRTFPINNLCGMDVLRRC